MERYTLKNPGIYPDIFKNIYISQLVYRLLDETSLLQEVSESPAPASKSEWHGQVLARPAITFCWLHRPCGSWISFSAAEMRKEGLRVWEVEACWRWGLLCCMTCREGFTERRTLEGDSGWTGLTARPSNLLTLSVLPFNTSSPLPFCFCYLVYSEEIRLELLRL